MDILDRYLKEVRFWLPKNQNQDIISELSEDIRSQIDDKEAERGRALDQSELVAILKQVGPPVIVANRFLPQQYLIGPVLFPIYKFILKIAALFYLIPWILVWMGLMIFNNSFREAHYSHGLIAAVGGLCSALWSTAFITAAVITVIFAVLEHTQALTGALHKWDPQKLPRVRDSNRIPRSSSITEFIVGVLFLVWWANTFSAQTILRFTTIQITLAPVWRMFFWGFLFVSIVNIALAATNIIHPYWTRTRASVRLLSDCVGSALFCWLLKSNIVANLTVSSVAASKTMALASAINGWNARILPVAILVCVGIAAFNVYRMFRVRTAEIQSTPGGAAAVVLL